MALELYYTSAPRGLKPGSSGFCTVAMTSGMPAALVQRLESLSGYRPIFSVGSPDEDRNPVDYAHWRLESAAPYVSVLSQVRFAGADEQGRFNKLAHHVVLQADEQAAGGPAWVMRQPGFMQPRWTGEPRTLNEQRTVPRGSNPPRVCRNWEAAAGDAGWAGVLVEAFLLDFSRPASVIYRPGLDVLALFDEAIALLPERQRWRVTMSTYFTALPAGMSCTWRGCVADSAAARAVAGSGAGSQGLVIDLTKALSPPRESKYVALARTGRSSDAAPGAGADTSDTSRRDERITAPVYRSAPQPVNRVVVPLDQEQELPVETAFLPPPTAGDDSAMPTADIRRVALWAGAILWPIVVLALGWVMLARRPATVANHPDATSTQSTLTAQQRAFEQREAKLQQRIAELENELRAELAKPPPKTTEPAQPSP